MMYQVRCYINLYLKILFIVLSLPNFKLLCVMSKESSKEPGKNIFHKSNEKSFDRFLMKMTHNRS